MCRACGGEWIGGVLLAGMAVTRFGGVAGAINPVNQISQQLSQSDQA
ncbi:hypothetical protein JX580_02305 [Thiomicrospira microaerophila]|nr:hypothetical protein [Thiomicrospira microaerophila]UQB42750.1 hypothetical protein JX580_02305 [Thiomicrospira microaerophila]